jgi:hypothetical protein
MLNNTGNAEWKAFGLVFAFNGNKPVMDHSNFAVCILFPGTNAGDIVNAAMKHNVLILDQETFDPEKDYNDYYHRKDPEKGITILPLFLFPSKSVLANNSSSLQEALDQIKALHQN